MVEITQQDGKNKKPTSEKEVEYSRMPALDHFGLNHKIDIQKFNGNNNFNMCRVEVMDALVVSNLEYMIEMEEIPEVINERTWVKMNQISCGIIRSYLS